MIRCVLTRETRWRLSFSSISLHSKVLCKNTIPILFFEILTELLNGRLDVIRPITKHSLFALTPPPESAIPGFRQDLVRTFGVTSRLDTVPSAHLRQLASVRPLTDNARHYTLEQFFLFI